MRINLLSTHGDSLSFMLSILKFDAKLDSDKDNFNRTFGCHLATNIPTPRLSLASFKPRYF